MTEKIIVKDLYKIFGPQPDRAIKMLRDGVSKDEIMKRTKLSVGIADVSFTVHEGEILVVMGLSGSGKSTLVRCINRLIEPSAGKVFLEDIEITSLSKDKLGYQAETLRHGFPAFRPVSPPDRDQERGVRSRNPEG
jgi:glycine betaine/proline transport system ATP-binding protein